MNSDRKSNDQPTVGAGVMMIIGLNAVQAAVVLPLAMLMHRVEHLVGVLVVGWGGAGLIQLTYAVPLYVYLKKQRKFQKAKGVIIGSCLIILINVTCWGFWQFGH